MAVRIAVYPLPCLLFSSRMQVCVNKPPAEMLIT